MEMLAKITDEELETLVDKAVDKRIAPKRPEMICTKFSETAKLSRLGERRLRAVVNEPDFRRQLDSQFNGPVYYPYEGQGYMFDYNGFARFVRNNLNAIFSLKIKGDKRNE